MHANILCLTISGQRSSFSVSPAVLCCSDKTAGLLYFYRKMSYVLLALASVLFICRMQAKLEHLISNVLWKYIGYTMSRYFHRSDPNKLPQNVVVKFQFKYNCIQNYLKALSEVLTVKCCDSNGISFCGSNWKELRGRKFPV